MLSVHFISDYVWFLLFVFVFLLDSCTLPLTWSWVLRINPQRVLKLTNHLDTFSCGWEKMLIPRPVCMRMAFLAIAYIIHTYSKERCTHTDTHTHNHTYPVSHTHGNRIESSQLSLVLANLFCTKRSFGSGSGFCNRTGLQFASAFFCTERKKVLECKYYHSNQLDIILT